MKIFIFGLLWIVFFRYYEFLFVYLYNKYVMIIVVGIV